MAMALGDRTAYLHTVYILRFANIGNPDCLAQTGRYHLENPGGRMKVESEEEESCFPAV